MEKLTVVQANELVEACYNLSIDELRVIALASTKVDSRQKSVGEIRIDVADFVKSFGLEKNNRVYSSLRDAVRSLMRKPIRLFDGNEVMELAWLQMNKHRTDNGSHVIIEFSPRIEPYLFELKERFTTIKFEYASKLNTPFSFRLYQWLCRAKNLNSAKSGDTVTVELDIDWMKTQSVLKGAYERWEAFNRKVIAPAIERINAHTDLSVIYEPVKTGRKVTSIKFTYVVEVGSVEKPVRPRLFRRPKVKSGSAAEGKWMQKNLQLLLDYESKLKAYDPSEKLNIQDLKRMAEYAVIFSPKQLARLESEIKARTINKAA